MLNNLERDLYFSIKERGYTLLIVDAFCVFERNGLYGYVDKWGKYRHIHVIKRQGYYLYYEDKVGVRHKSKVFVDEECGLEYIYLGRSGIVVDAFDLVDYAY